MLQPCSISQGMKAALYGDVVRHSDFEINLRPPGPPRSYHLCDFDAHHHAEESNREIQQSLDRLTKAQFD